MKATERPSESEWGSLTGWSAGQLELSGQPTTEEVRTAALRQLAEWDFVPPDRWQQACEILLAPRDEMGSPPPGALHGSEPVLAEVEEQLRQEVADFAAGFFRLPVEQRQARWRELHERTMPHPGLTWRLQRLEPGLTVEPHDVPPSYPEVVQLTQEIAGLFVLPPQQRAIRRRSLISEKRDTMHAWSPLARKLQQEYPRIAALTPEYVESLANWSGILQQLEKVRGRAAKARLDALYRRAKETQRRRAPANSGWPIAALVFMGIFLLRTLGTACSLHSNRSPPVYHAPTLQENVEARKAIEQLLKQARQRARKADDSNDSSILPQVPFSPLGGDSHDGHPSPSEVAP